MGVGIQVFNQQKTIQISSELHPLFLRKSGQISQSGPWTTIPEQRTLCRTTLPIDVKTWTCPLVFFRASHVDDRVTPLIWSKGELYFYRWWNLAMTAPIQYYIFDMWTPPERATAGLQIYSPTTKELIFDSSWKPLQIKKMFNIPKDKPGIEWGSNYAYQVDTGMGSNIAVGFSIYRGVSYGASGADPGMNGWLLRECAWIKNGTVFISNIMTQGDWTGYDTVPTTNPYEHGSKLYVIDTSILPNNYG